MYHLASKSLPLFFDPLVLAVVLLLGSFLVRKRHPRVFLITYVTAVVILVIGACPAAEGWLTGSLERQYPDQDVDSYPSAQAIVVLGGAIHTPSVRHHASGVINPSDRLLKALRLYRAQKAPLLVVSGGNDSLLLGESPDQPEAEIMRQLLVEWGIPEAAIEVEGGSINTHENALYSRQLLGRRGIGQIILVTSAIHMPRAAAVFRKAGFHVVAAPADFQTGWVESNAVFHWIPEGGSLVGSSRAIREWLGLWVYRFRGWA